MLRVSVAQFYLYLLIVSVVLTVSACVCSAGQTNETTWLTKNIYHEARDQDFYGKLMVALVTINRVESKDYPNTIQGVITQKKQFSWYIVGEDEPPINEADTYVICGEVAKLALMLWRSELYQKLIGQTYLSNVKYYHNTTVIPYWKDSYKFVGQWNDHLFYGDKS